MHFVYIRLDNYIAAKTGTSALRLGRDERDTGKTGDQDGVGGSSRRR